MAAAGGIERVISRHIEFLIEKHQIILVTKDDDMSFYVLPSELKHESLKVSFNMNMRSRLMRVFRIASTFFRTRALLRASILKNNPDIIYVASPLNLLEIFFAQFTCKNVLLTEHSSYNSYNIIYKLIVRIFYKKLALLTVPTQSDSKLYNLLGVPNKYLPNPLTFYPKIPSTLQNKIVLNVGRFTDDKRHELLIRIWSLSSGKDLGWQLKIIGQGENLEKILTLIRSLKLEESVSVHPVTSEIEHEFVSASVFLLTSRNEGFGLVLAEAMACGVPCVAFNCPSGPRDIVTDGRSGYLIAEDEIHSFVKRLDDLIDSEILRKTLGSHARFDVMRFEEGKISEELNILVSDHFTTLNVK